MWMLFFLFSDFIKKIRPLIDLVVQNRLIQLQPSVIWEKHFLQQSHYNCSSHWLLFLCWQHQAWLKSGWYVVTFSGMCSCLLPMEGSHGPRMHPLVNRSDWPVVLFQINPFHHTRWSSMETWHLSKAATLISHSSLLQWVARLLSFSLMKNKKRDWPKTDMT